MRPSSLPWQPLLPHQQAGQMLSAVHAGCLPFCLPHATGAEGAHPSPCELPFSVGAPSCTACWY